MGVACVQDIYRCDTCKSALDEYGRGCKHGGIIPATSRYEKLPSMRKL